MKGSFLGRAIGRCGECGEVFVESTGNPNGFKILCPTCLPDKKRIVKLVGMHGDFSESDRNCDDRCIWAQGASCDCQCGGANHSIGWASAPSLFLQH